MTFKDMISPVLGLLLMITACSTPESPVAPEPDPSVEARLILKNEVESMTKDSKVTSLAPAKGGYVISFTSGRKLSFDSTNYHLVGCSRNDRYCIDGEEWPYSFIGIPYYTLEGDGQWYKNGEPQRRAFPKNTMAGDGDICLSVVQEKYSEYVFKFSDNSTISVPKEISHKMYVRKSARQMDVFIGREGDSDYIMYPFYKREKAYSEGTYPAFLDNWGIGALELYDYDGSSFTKNSVLFLKGEAELAVNVPRGDDETKTTYVGGTLHGFENIMTEGGRREISIKIDGKEIAEGETFDLMEAGRIEMTQRSLICQAYTNGNPFAEAFRRWTFENGRLSIHIELKLLRDIRFTQGMFGMLCVLRHWEGEKSKDYLTCWAIKDNKPTTVYDITDDWQTAGSPLLSKDPGTYSITEYGQKGLSFALVVDADSRKNGGMHCGTNGNAYNKIYYDLTGNYSAKAGETLWSDVHWEIEKTRTEK